MPAELLDCIAVRLAQREQKAFSLVCTRWEQVIRLRTRTAAVSDGDSVAAVLYRFPYLADLDLRHVWRSSAQGSCVCCSQPSSPAQPAHVQRPVPASFDPSLGSSREATGTARRPAASALGGPLSPGTIQLTDLAGLRKLHIKDAGTQNTLNALLRSLHSLPQLTDLSVTLHGRSGQHILAEHSNFVRLPLMPQLKSLRLDGTGLTRNHHILPQPTLTSLALVDAVQLTDSFFADLAAQTSTLCAGSVQVNRAAASDDDR